MLAHDSTPLVRFARPADAPALAGLIRDFMRFEGKAASEFVDSQTVAGWIDGPDPVCEVLLAELEGRLAGYLAFYRAFSLFKGGPVLLVENLYIADHARRRGLGRRLLASAAAEARRRGQARIELHVRSDNPESRAFYESMGFVAPGESVYRIEDEALDRLAQDVHRGAPSEKP